jgi:hypothetical protein
MKIRVFSTLLILFACWLLTGCEALVSNALLNPSRRAKPAQPNGNAKAVSPDWYEGGTGYDQAYPEFVATKAPAALYFYTDW